MPVLEEEIGQRLHGLMERVVHNITHYLQLQDMTPQVSRWLFQHAFWLLAAKIFRDKAVPSFRAITLTDIDMVFSRIAQHYGAVAPQADYGQKEQEALRAAAETVAQFSHLGHVTTESLAYIYENTLISKELRSHLGIHSTPSYLVDYMVWRLAPWIEEIAPEERHVFEPACGHAPFLVAALRLLKDLHPTFASGPYVRQRLHGIDLDDFAIETARLALALADIPNPGEWDVRRADMFRSSGLKHLAAQAMIFLANPPFENMSAEERKGYEQRGVAYTYLNKTAELLHRVLPHLRPGAVFGIVVPQGLLYSKQAADLRTFMARECEIAEICLFPDKVFTFSDMESAVLLGRRASHAPTAGVRYRRVRESAVERFKQSYTATTESIIPQTQFLASTHTSMYIPELAEVWEWCRDFPTLDKIAEVGQGLQYKGQGLPAGALTISSEPFPGAVRGFTRMTPDLRIDGQPPERWLSVDPRVISRSRSGITVGQSQVLINYAPVSRSPWRLKAIIDRDGHAVTSRFLTLRPRTASWPLALLWGLCNSPFANAYVYTHTGKRDVLVGTIRAMPVPHLAEAAIQHVVGAVQAYLEAVRPFGQGQGMSSDDQTALCRLLQHVDAEVLRLYDLPPRMEHQILALFSGWKRPGVPFDFSRYFPEDFAPCLPLHVYLSAAYERSTAGALRRRYQPVTDPQILAALDRAVQAFAE